MKSGKLIGYCPNCELPIVDFDIVNMKKCIYRCLGCLEENGLDKLKKERKIERKVIIDIEEE